MTAAAAAVLLFGVATFCFAAVVAGVVATRCGSRWLRVPHSSKKEEEEDDDDDDDDDDGNQRRNEGGEETTRRKLKKSSHWVRGHQAIWQKSIYSAASHRLGSHRVQLNNSSLDVCWTCLSRRVGRSLDRLASLLLVIFSDELQLV